MKPIDLVCKSCGGDFVTYDKNIDRDDFVCPLCEKKKSSSIKSVPQALADLGAIYKERNATYGDTYKNFGGVMKGFFPKSVTIETSNDWNRMALFFHLADKLARYASTFHRGGHADSLDDLSVYSQMLQEFDAECREWEK